MVAAQHIADRSCALPVRLIPRQAILIHGIKNAAMNRFQAVPHIRQSAADDNRHCVFNIAFLHFLNELRFNNHLVREGNVLRFIIFLFRHSFVAP